MQKSDEQWASGSIPDGIVTIGDPALRRVCSRATDIQAAEAIAEAMVARLRQLNGAGLAANQIGIDQAIAVVEVRRTDLFPDRPECPLTIMINPKIVKRLGPVIEDWEGCFSVPNLMAKIPRHSSVLVEFTDEEGHLHKKQFTGYVARTVQHEVDHLGGLIFVDRVSDTRTYTTIAHWKESHVRKDVT